MIALVLCLIAGDCRAQQVSYAATYAQAVQYQAAYQVVPIYTVTDTQDSAARLRATEDAILKLTAVVEQQNQLLQQAGGALKQTGSKYEADARRILAANCTSCHKPGKTQGDLDLTGEIPVNTKMLLSMMASDGDMPPGPKKLNESDIETLAAWAGEDKAAIKAHLKGGSLK